MFLVSWKQYLLLYLSLLSTLLPYSQGAKSHISLNRHVCLTLHLTGQSIPFWNGETFRNTNIWVLVKNFRSIFYYSPKCNTPPWVFLVKMWFFNNSFKLPYENFIRFHNVIFIWVVSHNIKVYNNANFFKKYFPHSPP